MYFSEKKATIAVGKTATVKVKSLKGISAKGVKFASSNKKVHYERKEELY